MQINIFWQQKILTNIERDKYNYSMCINNGWEYLVIWGCEIKLSNLDALKAKLSNFLTGVKNGY
jgi:G:T-mismatch repair DNA endonuclease (very short patch repair protein)